VADERTAFKTIGRAIHHRRSLVMALIALFTLGAGAAALLRPPTYQATALLFVDERFNSSQGFDLALQAGELLSTHYINEANSQPVLERACSGKYFDASKFSCSPALLANHVSASTVQGTDAIAISATSRSAEAAAALANAVANALVDQDRADVDALMGPTRDYLNGALDQLGKQIADEQATIQQLEKQTPPGEPAHIAGDQAQLTMLETQYGDTYAQLQNLQIEQSRLSGSLTLAQPATTPTKPIDPDPLRYLLVGLVAGICFGVLAAVLLDRYDDRLFETDTLAQAAGTSLVVSLASNSSAPSVFDSYALARASLLALHPYMHKLLVVAASPHGSVRSVAAGIGMAAASTGQKVLVVDAETKTGEDSPHFSENGSTMTIVNAPSSGDATRAVRALAEANGEYDLTVVSVPSPDHDPTAMMLAHAADVAVVVATARQTRFSEVRRTSEALRLAGIHVAAALFTAHGASRRSTVRKSEVTDVESTADEFSLPTHRASSE
jgi:capsular polysaccharide biosynthesis protein